MARIPLTNGFVRIPEGVYVFRIYEVKYDEDFGKLEVKMVTAKGQTHTERFALKNNDDTFNERVLNSFSYFAKTALNDSSQEDIDPEELVDRYIKCEIKHNEADSTKKPGEKVVFVNLGDKEPADGFEEEPTGKALSLGGKGDGFVNVAEGADLPWEDEKQKGLDLDALLG